MTIRTIRTVLCRCSPARLADDEYPEVGARAMAASRRPKARSASPIAAAPAEAVEIGLRPEDIKVAALVGRRHAAGRRKVFEVEPLGGYTVVTLDAGQSRLRALMRGQPDIRPEAMVALSCEPGRVHYFAARRRSAGTMSSRRRRTNREEDMARSQGSSSRT